MNMLFLDFLPKGGICNSKSLYASLMALHNYQSSRKPQNSARHSVHLPSPVCQTEGSFVRPESYDSFANELPYAYNIIILVWDCCGLCFEILQLSNGNKNLISGLLMQHVKFTLKFVARHSV